MRYNNIIHNYFGTLKSAKKFQMKVSSHDA